MSKAFIIGLSLLLVSGFTFASGTKGSSTKSIGPVIYGTWYTTFEREGKTYIMKEVYAEDHQMARSVYLPGEEGRPLVYQWSLQGKSLVLSIDIKQESETKTYRIKRTLVGLKTYSMRLKSADGSVLDFTRKPPTPKKPDSDNRRRRRE